MTVKITKPALNLREELNKLDKPSGITGESLLRADTAADAKKTLGIDNFEQVSVSTDGVISADGLNLGDSDKIQLGDSNDLQIYHDGSNSIITDNGTGDLSLRGNGLKLQNPSGETYINCVSSGAVGIRYDDATKLATTSTGVNVTGTVTADGLDVNSGASNNVASFISTDYQAHISFSDSSTTTAPRIGAQGDDLIAIRSGTEYLYRSYSNGNFSLFENTGTTPKFHWDASAERLGLGTTNPDGQLDVRGGLVTDVIVRSTSANSTSRVLYQNDARTYSTKIHTNDRFQIKDETADTARFTIDTSGNTGIGTDSPDGKLHIDGATDTVTGLIFEAGVAGNNKFIDFQNTAGAKRMGIEYYNNNVALNIVNRSADKLITVKESDGNVGIGTDSPSRLLHVKDTGSQTVALFDGGANSAGEIGFRTNGTSGDTYVTIGAVANDMVLSAGASERLRISSGGNVLVGKTSASANTAGIELNPAGFLRITRGGAEPLHVNRTANDGELISLRRNNNTVGSIGVASGQLGIDSQGTRLNLQLSGTTKAYVRSGSLNPSGDNTFDLGESSERFKDLYLSGGAYLGGVAAANKLDDYEEGTWTPTVEGATSAGSATYSFQAGNYTKVGNLVMAAGRVTFSGHTGTGNMELHGLPFTSTNTGFVEPNCVIHGVDISLTANNTMVATVKRNDSFVEVLQATVGGGSRTTVAMDSAGTLNFTIIYQAA